MDDTPAPEKPAKDFNKLDLTQLQGFSFGTQWSQDKTASPEQRERNDRPRREGGFDRRDGGAPERRDRRAFRKPAGDSAPSAPASAPAAPAPEEGGRRDFSRGPGPRREFSGGPRREGNFERGGPRFDRRNEPQMERGPYESPFFAVAFYPEDTSFNALAKTIRSSCRTIELFQIARTVVEKADRFVVVLTRKPSPESADAKRPLYLSVPDGLPFESEEAALAHVLTTHLDKFFDLAEVEIEAPKGNFQVINKCGVTGELLGPPNYHRYSHIVQQHHAAKVARMPFEAYRSRIETIRDPEVVAQWLEKMKKTTRYTWKASAKPAAAISSPAAEVAADASTPAPTAEVASAEVALQAGSTTPETAPAITFDNFEDARAYLLGSAKDKVVRPIESARFHGKLLESIPQGEIRRAVEGALERQRRFPLDTANALRGRLRREHFTIFKKGSKGISYVCAVKRKFRVPGQTFSDSISGVISFIETHPMVRASELPSKFLGIDVPAVKPVEAPASADAAAVPTPAPVEPALSIEQRAKISRTQGDLRWLVAEGYVTEFIDGRLFAPPPVVEARKKEVESEEHDPENFPEAPAEAKVAVDAPPAPAAEELPAVEELPPAEPAGVEDPSPAAPPEPPPSGLQEEPKI